MVQSDLIPFIVVAGGLYGVAILFSYWWLHRIKRNILEKDREAKRRLYEIAILKEIADRTGYSLNIQKILDVIMGSLNQFLEYSAVSYMLLDPAKIVFKVHFEHSVSTHYLDDIRTRMLASLSALSGREIGALPLEEFITGALSLENNADPVNSYFNIPLVIAGQLVGVLTVSDIKTGLYNQEEMELLYKIVQQASQAVTNLEEVVRTEQGKISATLESMIEGVIMTDRDYRVIAANPAIKKSMNFEGLLPTIFEVMDTFQGVFDIRACLEESMKLDKVITLEEIFFKESYYQVVVSPVRSNKGVEKGEMLGGVVLFHDITHEKEAEEMRKDFTAMMVHELRSPLGNIKKIGELMKSSKILEDKKASSEYASMLYESSSLMLDLVNDLLDVAKLESGKFDIDKQQVSLQELLTERVKFFEITAQSGDVTLTLSVDQKVPLVISGDARRLTQVVNNLLSNAIKFTPRGGKVSLVAFLHQKGNTLSQEAITLGYPWQKGESGEATAVIPKSIVIALTDTGEGMSDEQIQKLFNKFTQFASSARNASEYKGTGLGLVIVKGIVEAHGGVVRVGSKIGEGSTFYFTLPL